MRATLLIVLIVGGLVYAWREGWFGTALDAANRGFSVHFSKGQGLYLKGKYLEAIQEYNEALEQNPQNPEVPTALTRMGDCYKALKEYRIAAEMYDRVLNEFPDYNMLPRVEQSREELKGHI